MWRLVAPMGALVVQAIFRSPAPLKEAPKQKSILKANFVRLATQLRVHNEIKVAIMGQPGAGKSSLLKGITNGQATPAPVIGSETDATNWATDANCTLLSYHKEYAFADVPGYDTQSHPTDVFLPNFPFDQFDAFILVIHGKLHSADEAIFTCIARQGKTVCIVRSFSESLDESERRSAERDIRQRLSPPASTKIIFLSNRMSEGIAAVSDAIKG